MVASKLANWQAGKVSLPLFTLNSERQRLYYLLELLPNERDVENILKFLRYQILQGELEVSLTLPLQLCLPASPSSSGLRL